MSRYVSQEDEYFFNAFMQCSLKPEEFHHREHIKLAYILLLSFAFPEARWELKHSLCQFLEFNNVSVDKYHETLSGAWLQAVKHFMHQTPNTVSADDFIRQNAHILDVSIMDSHYSRELLDSDKARAIYIMADLEPIPVHKHERLF